MKLVSRSQWGARAYRTPNGATPYSRARRGVKLHYLGTAYSDRSHDKCDDYVRQIQAQHMDGNGWSDIGYSFAVCTHGYVYEGRGLKRRNSANGNTTLNDQDYAVLLMVGSSGLTKPTDAQLNGARDAIEYCRKEGPAGTWLGGHRDGYATSCPGDPIYAWVKAGAPRPAAQQEDDDMPTAAEIADAVVAKLLAGGGVLENSDFDRLFGRDAIPAARPPYNNPDYFAADGKTVANDTWTFKYAVQTAVENAREAVARLKGLEGSVGTVDMTDADIAALASAVASNPALAEQIAEKVAVKLAERLAD
ncbi:N-acetylmuramoyl-L-alanine amidase [Streptomyces sp. NBC_01614]|uniref:N-acetylmuramoyl-L-alanine amidase n=1 Tax=Streptomyces sp. NBC_01614 TaxID=2975897 RepID=UPI003868D10F